MTTPAPRRIITKKIRYAVKHLSSGAARIYINNSEALRNAGFLASSNVRIVNSPNSIKIYLDPNGSHKVMNSGRGELLELRNKDTANAVGKVDFVMVSFRDGCVSITVHGLSERQSRRESLFLSKIKSGQPLRSACLCSGTGMLSYHIKQGLEAQGFKTEIAFANEHNELAMSCNLEGNPMWDNASDDAIAIVDDIHAVDLNDVSEVDYATIGYPCVGFSLLADKNNLDIFHGDCGTLFIPLVAILRKMNPAMLIFENAPRFIDSTTLHLLEKSFPDYNFSKTILNGHDYNELESRKRACIIATSKGLPAMDLSNILSLYSSERPPVISDVLSNVDLDASCWRVMEHVKLRDTMKNVGYRNCLYYGHESSMTTIPASYGSPKAGTPMIAHPEKPELQRQVQVDEHAHLRGLPERMVAVIMSIWNGAHPLVSTRGSATACHRLLGNGVSKRVWTSLGSAMGAYFKECNLALN
jgi:DNA (cytosine-5)-methyltransferase 1